MPKEQTSAKVSSIAARVLPMNYPRFVIFIASPENFRAVKSAIASVLTQREKQA